jgi:pyruvate/2-oxoglutarate dehydrogenase complex dihydrolipoamide dehydrogenase (E3) component
MHTHDAIVIGSGQAGPFLAVRLAQSGLKVALVEREHYGGTCVNTASCSGPCTSIRPSVS